MTTGKPAGLLLSFALPLMAGNICQQLYTMVDTMVVGQVLGVEALASLGAADWLNWLVLGIIMGFTQGFSILISQRFGAEDQDGLRKVTAMSTLLSAVIAVVVTVSSLLLAEPVLRLLNTPDNVLPGSLSYLRIIFSGSVIVTTYNMMASILRAMGDSRTPLYAMLVASVVNIGLDLLFVMGFHWGIPGAAAATVIAQGCSCLFCLAVLRRMSVLRMTKTDWHPDGSLCRRLFQLGLPMAFQNTVIAVGGLVIQFVINGFGFLFVAGFTATNKLYGLLELAATSFGFSMATYAGQNLGAKKYRRICEGMRSALKMAVATSVVISAAMIAFGKPVLLLFISGEPGEVAQVLDIAYTYLFIMCCLLSVLYLLHLYRSALQGMGDTVIPMVSGIAELTMRIGCALLLPIWLGQYGIYFAEIAAWAGAVVILVTFYYIRIHHLLHGIPDKRIHVTHDGMVVDD